MCGIVGIISGSSPPDADRLEAMRETLRHRGPDDRGLWRSNDGRVALAHCRLSIIDLSADARQPMAGPRGGTQVVFNGEIYNYRELREELEAAGRRFRTASDTEVLLQAYEQWGVDCLARLNGMFAFGLFDAASRRLLLARDRAGEKPLFYRHANRRLTFGSELKTLFADPGFPRRLDHRALEHYLAFGYVPHDLCLVEGVRKLPQGHALTYDLDTDQLRRWPYWRLPDPPQSPQSGAQKPTDELVAELEDLLTDSVRLRLIADVPVGIMLSGGIDSSLVTAMAARVATGRVKTFTISFPGYGAYDEAPYARAVAHHFGTDHVELAAEPATVELLPELATQYDEPIADSSMVPTYIISRLIRREATVALGGDGGDELFGGYPYYSWLQAQDRARALLPESVRKAARSFGGRLPLGWRGRSYIIGMGLDVAGSIAHANVFFDAGARRRLLRGQAIAVNGGSPEAFKRALCRTGQSLLQQATAADFQAYLVDDILVKVDRASMLASLEVRAPWLDPRIIEFAFRLPDALRATARERKILPRAFAARVLPPTLDLTRKRGFSLPLDAWFTGDWGRYIEEVLREADASLFDRTFIDHLIAAQRRGLGNTQRLFALTMFELWRRHYRISVG